MQYLATRSRGLAIGLILGALAFLPSCTAFGVAQRASDDVGDDALIVSAVQEAIAIGVPDGEIPRIDPALWLSAEGYLVRPDRSRRVGRLSAEVLSALELQIGSADRTWPCQGTGGIRFDPIPNECRGQARSVLMVGAPRSLTAGGTAVDVVSFGRSFHFAATFSKQAGASQVRTTIHFFNLNE